MGNHVDTLYPLETRMDKGLPKIADFIVAYLCGTVCGTAAAD